MNLTTKVAVAICAFAIGIWIPVIIGPELFGTFSFLSAGLSFIISISSMGFGAGIVYLLSSSKYGTESTLYTNLLFGIGMGFINALLIGIAFFVPWFDPVLSGSSDLEIILVLGSALFQSLSYTIGRSLLGTSRFASLNRIEMASAFLSPLSLLGLYYVAGKECTSFIYLALFCYSFLVFLLHGFWIGHQSFIKKFNSPYFHEAMDYGRKSWAGDMALRANLRLDQLILGAMVQPAALGIYSVAVRLAELIWFIPDAAGPVLFNAIAACKENDERVFILARTHRIIFTVCVFLALAWLLLIRFIVLPFVLNGPYGEVLPLLVILVPGTLFLVSSKMVTKLLSSTGQVIYTTRITVIGSAVSVLLYFLLIPLSGPYGAAIASTLGYGVLALAGWVVIRQRYVCKFREFFIPKSSDWVWIAGKYNSLWKGK